jgi:hypothetical protein
MTKVARDPMAILARASKAHLVRQVALELKVPYEELAPGGPLADVLGNADNEWIKRLRERSSI